MLFRSSVLNDAPDALNVSPTTSDDLNDADAADKVVSTSSVLNDAADELSVWPTSSVVYNVPNDAVTPPCTVRSAELPALCTVSVWNDAPDAFSVWPTSKAFETELDEAVFHPFSKII